MTKEERRKMIDEFVRSNPERVTVLPPGVNPDFQAWLLTKAKERSGRREAYEHAMARKAEAA